MQVVKQANKEKPICMVQIREIRNMKLNDARYDGCLYWQAMGTYHRSKQQYIVDPGTGDSQICRTSAAL